MTEKTLPTSLGSADMKLARRFILNSYFDLFVEGDSPDCQEITLRQGCGDYYSCTKILSDYRKLDGNLPRFSRLQKWDQGSPGIAYCGWHPVFNYLSGKIPPQRSQIKEFDKKYKLQNVAREALKSRSADATQAQLVYLKSISALDCLADVLRRFRKAQADWDQKKMTKLNLAVRKVWFDVKRKLPEDVVPVLEKLLYEGVLACKAESTELVYNKTFCQRLSISFGHSEECQVGINEAVDRKVESKLLRFAFFASGAVCYKDNRWEISLSSGVVQLCRFIVVSYCSLWILWILIFGFTASFSVIGVIRHIAALAVIAVPVIYFSLLFLWPARELNYLRGGI